jgi:hypothetical protein
MILIQSQPVFALSPLCYTFSGEATKVFHFFATPKLFVTVIQLNIIPFWVIAFTLEFAKSRF